MSFDSTLREISGAMQHVEPVIIVDMILKWYQRRALD
jgi:hypothetical protein